MNFYGLNTMKRPNRVGDGETPDGRNFVIVDNRLETRAGFEKENSVALGSFPRAIIDFKSDKCNMSNIIIIENDGTVVSDPLSKFKSIDANSGKYVFAIFQQKYDFNGNTIANNEGDVWIFAYTAVGTESIAYYKRVPWNYTIAEIKDTAWVQAANDLGVTTSFWGSNAVQSPNGRIWITAYREYTAGVDIRLLTTYFDGTSWQDWARFNNRDIAHSHFPGITVDGTNVIFIYLLDGGEADETPNTERELYYKSVSQGVTIGDIQAVSDTYVLTLGVNAVFGTPILKTSTGNFVFIYQLATTQAGPYTSSLYSRTASTVAGLATATVKTIVANYPAGGGIDTGSITEVLSGVYLISAYNKTGDITFAYKNSIDDGVNWNAETVVDTAVGDGNLIYCDLKERLNFITNVNNSDYGYMPYFYRTDLDGNSV